MKRFFAGLVLLLCAFSIFAQNKVITVSGRVVESDSKEPAAQATVQLLSLPDSAYAAGIASSNQGWFTLPKVKAGKYVLKISYIGFQTKIVPVQLTANVPDKKMGNIELQPDAVMLKEAVVTAEAPQVTVKEDTLEYNSAAYRTPEGAMLEELVKKLPGAEIDDDGNVKINGKEVKKIMVDGKEFFGGDVKTGLKNLPVNMIDKLKTYDKKSDLARVTGIDDGEEETVLDLKVKKGMNQGWFGNASVAGGTEDRYGSNLMLNRFVDNSQFSLIGSANNVNDQGFSGGGGPRFRNSNGLTATKMLGANFATQTEKLELGGSARYNYSDRDAISKNYSELIMPNGNSYSNSNSKNRNKNMNFNADFRLEWKPDTLTNIIFRPNVSYGKSKGYSISESGTFNDDPLNWVSNPNDFLNKIQWGSDDPLKDIRVNASNSESASESESLSANASLQVNRRLNNMGRNITFRGTFGYGDSDSEQFSESLTRYFDPEANRKDDERKQYITSPSNNYDYTAELTYNEPIAKATFLQFRYKFQYRYSESDRSTYSLIPETEKLQDWIWNFGDELPEGYENNKDMSLSKYAQYKYYNHDINAGMNIIREKYRFNFGLSLQPQNTRLDYKKAEIDTVVKRNVFNFAPNVDFRYRFSKVSQLRFTYRGRAGQPSMENLLDITDDSNPLRITKGNPGLKPSFTHSMRLFYNTYNADKQRGMMAHANFNTTQNKITNATKYNQKTGGTITQPENINGYWTAMGMFGFNTALKDKRFTINSFSRASYTNDVSFLYNDDTQVNDKNTSTSLTLAENLNGTFRNDWFEFTINGSINYNFERNKLNPSTNQEPYTFGYGASTNISLPWSMTLSTNITNNSRRGYRDASMNRNELIWNAQIAQSFLKGNAATISFEIYDILRQQSNISRSLSEGMRSVSEYNGINSYCMLRFSYRLNVFGNKEARGNIRQGGFDGGGHRGPRGPQGTAPIRMMRY
ncbi:TonB-dependent receptor [uncultured Bacteroides sp.]|uniref:TonB-dependent receptor n=1 Tax=uncultured Bacteroides sp. TaxID=162156 RepID=UPI0025F99528|nr:TonB-dependent receptor [uncultured Bacteroides sp.]